MYRNYHGNCCCSKCIFNYYNHCCHYASSSCFPLNYYPCELYCHHPVKRFPLSYRKLSAMPLKPIVTSETASITISGKLKKKTKTKRCSKQCRDSVMENISLKGNSNSEYPRCSSADGSNNVRLSHSESLVGRRPSIDSGNNTIKNSDSYCNYQCSCKPSKGCLGKPAIEFNMLTHKGVLIKQIYKDRGSSCTNQSNNIKQNFTSLDNLTSPLNSNKISNNSRNTYTTQSSFAKRASKGTPHYSHSSQVSKCFACSNCQHSVKKCSAIQNQFCPCYCNLCQKTSSTRANNPLITDRQSFSSSISCPQLDVISEEEAENEEFANFISSQSRRNAEAHSKPIAAGPTKIQKCLEDSCLDFLNIVSDNILESVEKSLDQKLQEYSNNVTKNFESLDQKLGKSESAVECLCMKIMEKMTEQNKNNLEQIYALVQNLMENQAANQYAMLKTNHQDKECQCKLEIKEENEFVTNVEQDINTNNGSKEETIMTAKTQLYTCCHGNDTNPTLYEKNPTEKDTNVAKNEPGAKAKPQSCSCCHCNDANSALTLQLHKTYSNSTVEEQIDHHHRSAEQNSPTTSAHSVGRLKGGCTDCGKNKSVKWEDDVKFLKLPIKLPTQEDVSPRISSVLSQPETNFPQKSCTTHRDTSPHMFTTFSLTPCGKTIFDCNCSTECSYGSNKNISLCVLKGNTNMELKSICRNLNDNYDTSGYATEPEDNNGPDSSSSVRKKKTSKQHCCSSTLEPNTQQILNNASVQDNCKKKRGSQLTRRLSQENSSSYCNTSPTRLSRL